MGYHKLTVCELRSACLSEEWRKRWKAGANPTSRLERNTAGFAVGGRTFHKLAQQCERGLVELPGLLERDALWDWLYREFGESTLARLVASYQHQQAAHLAECLKFFCRRLAAVRQERHVASWADLFSRSPVLKDVPIEVGEHTFFISGEVDSLRWINQREVEIVDYKLSGGEHRQHDVLQVGIYAALLQRVFLAETSISGCLEYYSPELEAINLSTDELLKNFETFVPAALSDLAGVSGEKSGREGPTAPTKEVKPPQGSSGNKNKALESDGVARSMIEAFNSFKLPIKVSGRLDAPQLIRYLVQPQPGVKVSSLQNRAEDIQVALALEHTPAVMPGKGFVSIDLAKEKPDTVCWSNVMNRKEMREHKSIVAFPVGIDTEDQLLLGDFADSNMAHALVAGASGSGKSEFLKSMAAALAARNAPEQVRFDFIDPKQVTFMDMQDLPHVQGKIVTTIEGSLTVLRDAAEEMDRRYALLSKRRLKNLSECFDSGITDIPFRILIFDEFADLILTGRKEKETFERLVARITAKGRAAGVHLVLATQRPDRSVVTGLIKANLQLKVCFRVTDTTNSQIVLGEPGAEKLIGRGDLLCDLGRGVVRAQSPFLTREALQGL